MNSYRYLDDVEEAIKLGLAAPNARKVHLHTLNGRPLVGTTTALSIIGSKDGVMQWYADMAALAALKCPVQDIQEEYEAVKVIKDKKERAKAMAALDKKYPDFAKSRRAATDSRDDSAEKGTDRHSLLEAYVKLCLKMNGGVPMPQAGGEIYPFVEWAMENVSKFIFSEAHGYSELLWVGGICDVGFEMKNGKRIVGDFKSSKEAYENMFLQTALYDMLLIENGMLTRDGKKIGDWKMADGYAVFPFRSEPFTPEFRWNTAEFRWGAAQAVGLYKLLELSNN